MEELGLVRQLWNVLLICLIGYFVISMINQFAQQKQMEIDEEKVSKK
jgi:hypothetical protein